jgi:hypothetical protein
MATQPKITNLGGPATPLPVVAPLIAALIFFRAARLQPEPIKRNDVQRSQHCRLGTRFKVSLLRCSCDMRPRRFEGQRCVLAAMLRGRDFGIVHAVFCVHMLANLR